eukprot:jgi/Picsp_1/4119/NSC_01629-R1_ap4a phosphorylase ii
MILGTIGANIGRPYLRLQVAALKCRILSISSAAGYHDRDGMESQTRNSESPLWNKICATYRLAQDKGAASLTRTSTETLEDQGFQYILKIASNLRDKPKPKKDKSVKQARNPFLPPDPDLFVSKLSTGQHSCVLNKFNLVAHHCIIITDDFHPQEEPLDARDFEACWEVVCCMPAGGLAYFNCGENSGASQPHKHIQCIPLPLACDDAGRPLESPFHQRFHQGAVNANEGEVFSVGGLPFVHAAFGINQSFSSKHGKKMFEYIEKQCGESMSYLAKKLEKGGIAWSPRSDSYNILMTREYFIVIPRSSDDNSGVGCNAMGYAGSFFLASKDEIEQVKLLGPSHVLQTLGFANPEE